MTQSNSFKHQTSTIIARTIALAVAGAACACGAEGFEGVEADEAIGESQQQVVYGTDDRQDVYATTNADLAALARRSTVAMMPSWMLNTSDPNNVQLNATTLGAAKNLCTDQRFRNDPVASECSGTLIHDDLVLTAGHCINATTCSSKRFVFGFYRDSATTLNPITTGDVFSCRSIVARQETDTVDYAIVRLDRSATPRYTPAPLKTGDAALGVNTPQGVIGTGSNIPFKVDAGGRVRDSGARGRVFYTLTSDTFGGNSGSGVYDLFDYRLSGILVRGATDYVARGSCTVVNTCAETGCSGEDAVYVRRALDGLCAAEAGHPLCGNRSGFDFSASNTSSATRNTRNHWVYLKAGQTLDAGTCGVTGGSGTGDTYLRVHNAQGAQVAANDDSCGGRLSRVQFTAPSTGLYEVRAGCYSTGSCSGTVAISTGGAVTRVHRRHHTCDGAQRDAALGYGEEAIIDLRTRSYSNYTCANRFEEQCVRDGSWDSYYVEYCDYN